MKRDPSDRAGASPKERIELKNAFQIVRVKEANLEYKVSRDLRGIKHSRDG